MMANAELPEGWTREELAGDCVCFARLGGGFVTVDFKERIFALGHSRPRKPATTFVYVGTRWRQRLIRDAIEYLEQTLKETA
jgi:hypothetical protein